MKSKIQMSYFFQPAPKILLNKREIKEIVKLKNNKLILVDLSVPRNLPSDLNIKKLELINIDNLKDVVNENYKKRKKQIIKAEEFIEDFLMEFNEWTHSRTLRPSILSIKNDIINGIVDQTLSELNGLKTKKS